MKPKSPSWSGTSTWTVSPSTVAVASGPFASTERSVSAPPSGSESFASTRTAIVRPGRTVMVSSTAIGARAPSSRGAMPTRTEPVARAPSASTTAYWNVSVPAEYSPASYSSQSPPRETTAPRSGLDSCPSSCTESPSGSVPPSGMGMRTVSPAITRAVTVCGTGAELVSGSASRTEMCTFAVANCPSEASTRYFASNSPASSGAKYRSRSPVAKRSPPAGSSRRSGASVSASASGCSSLSSTPMSTTSPVRAEMVSGAATGGWYCAGCGTSTTVTSPSASARPLLTR